MSQLSANQSTSPPKDWEAQQFWTNLNTGEVFPDVTTPITWSVIQLFTRPLFRSVLRLVGADATRTRLAGLVAGRIYFNANTGLAAVKPFKFILARSAQIAQAIGGGDPETYQSGVMNIPEEDLPDLGFRWPRYILCWPRLLIDLLTRFSSNSEGWRPRTKARVDKLVALDIQAMSTPDLVQLFTKTAREDFEDWDLLYVIKEAAVLPLFQKACRDWLGDKNLSLAYRLFAAMGNVPETEAGLTLWRLAALAHASPETKSCLQSALPWKLVRESLEQTEPGRHFLAAWDAFMCEHGHHCRGELELFNPRWAETPDYILAVVRSYLFGIEDSNPLEKQSQMARERQALTQQCCRRLKNPLKRWLFSSWLGRAQQLAITREEWKNQAVRQLTFLRRILRVLGERCLQAGVLARPDDIFFLEVPDIELLGSERNHSNLQELIRQRRQEYEANKKLSPPKVVIGKFPPDKPAPSASLITHKPSSRSVLQGIAVSAGLVTGRAKVILRSNDHDHVLPGEILVAPFTDPAWTPYFVHAAGLVVEQGGILSHGSIIAREYGLPAVTNVASATEVIRTGDQIEVDGNNGRVIILKRAG